MNSEDDIFSCRQCGHCCQGETTVSLNDVDMRRLVSFMRKPRQEVIDKYLRVTGNVIQMKTVEGRCIFFTNLGCSIHPAKPWRCRQWPLHESILSDENNFLAIKDSCPGISRNVSYAEFCRKLSAIVNSSK